MHQTVNPSRLDPSVRSLLDGLRRRIRAYVWIDAIATIVFWTALAFWISLAIDWTFEPSPRVRWFLLGGIAGTLGVVVYRALLRKCFARLSDPSMALLIERRNVELRDSLLTTVELASTAPDHEPFDRAMLDQVRDQAVDLAQGVRLRQIFDFRPLIRIAAAAFVLAASVLLFFFLAPAAYATWNSRVLWFATEPWPRDTSIIVEGFDSGVMKVARGDDVEIVALADITMVVPEVVTMFYGTENSGRRRVNMNRHGNATLSGNRALARSRHQRFSYQLKNVQRETMLEIRGGDARLRGLRIVPVAPPTLTDIAVYCEFPEYLVDQQFDLFLPREIPVTGTISVPQGTSVEIRATANKSLADVRWKDRTDAQSREPVKSDWLDSDRFTIPLGQIDEDVTLSFVLTDTDQIKNRRAIQLAIRAKPDTPPQVAVQLEGIGSDVTPNARLPLRGTITDDYGVTQTSFEYQIGSDPAKRLEIDSPSGKPVSIEVDYMQELTPLELQPGQELQISMTAADTLWSHRKERLEKREGSKLGANDTVLAAIEANVGRSQPYSLRVVTPERLRSILATREWTLTRRFKSLVRDFEQMRDSLVRIQFAGNDSTTPAVDSPQKARARRLGTMSAALRASRSVRRGSLDLATDFERILTELENNRISTADLRPRLHERIAVPLTNIAGEPLERLIELLGDAQAVVSDLDAGAIARNRAVEQAERVLVEMNRVLKAMKASEEFNELILRVRKLIEDQARLIEKTDKARKAAERKALDLLDD